MKKEFGKWYDPLKVKPQDIGCENGDYVIFKIEYLVGSEWDYKLGFIKNINEPRCFHIQDKPSKAFRIIAWCLLPTCSIKLNNNEKL